ncbi:hypothetical protein BGZ95_008530, partial [Linnemannia exigua]
MSYLKLGDGVLQLSPLGRVSWKQESAINTISNRMNSTRVLIKPNDPPVHPSTLTLDSARPQDSK